MNNTRIEGFRLSPSQKRLWQLQRRQPGAWLNQQCLVRLTRPLTADRLCDRVNQLAEQMEILRTSFSVLPGMTLPVQVVGHACGDVLEFVDLAHLGEAVQRREIEAAWLTFASDNAPESLLRLRLFHLGDTRQALLVRCSCLVMDGTALVLFLRKLLEAGEDTTQDAIQFADVAEWLHETANEHNDVARDYWREVQASSATLDWLPRGVAPRTDDTRVAEVNRAIDPVSFARVRALAAQFDLSIRAILLAAYLLPARRLGAPGLALRVSTDGRGHDELAGLIGPLERTLPLRVVFDKASSFFDFCRDLEARWAEAESFGDYFQDVETDDGETAELPETSCFEFRRAMLADVGAAMERHVGGFDLFSCRLSASEDTDHVRLTFTGNWRALDASFLELMADRLAETLSRACAQPQDSLDSFGVHGTSELQALLGTLQGPECALPAAATICSLFREVVERHPDRHAVNDGNGLRTYAALEADSNRLARLLQSEAAVERGEIVALHAPRSYEMIVGMLAILKAGGVYAPIDPGAPGARKNQMLHDMAARVVVIGSKDSLDALEGTVLIRIDDPRQAQCSPEAVEERTTPSDLAYCIYTSGSTGVPKGVLVAHGNVVNLIVNHRRLYGECPYDRVSQVANMSFDSSCAEIWPCLLNGAGLWIVSDKLRLDHRALKAWLIEQEITIAFLPTALAERLIAEEWPAASKLRILRTGGDKLKVVPAHPLPFRFYNEYGPTEATVWVTCKEVLSGGEYRAGNIGSPGLNEKVHVLDAEDGLQPIGVFGEIGIAGAGVAAGYLNRPTTTRQKFVPLTLGEKRVTVYRTGDIGRWLPSGELDFQGRVDGQVKIRGYRVELGEIETALLRHPQIKSGVVLAVEADAAGSLELVAFFSATVELSREQVFEFLTAALPRYMIPDRFFAVAEMPLTTRGKVDREALLGLARTADSGTPSAPPKTETEKTLAEIWKQLLRLDWVGRTDNFFRLGGHSLRAMDLLSRIAKKIRVEISLREIFECPVLADLARAIDQKASGAYEPIVSHRGRVRYPATPQQQRILALHRFDTTAVIYNVTQGFLLKGPLDSAAAIHAFAALTQRHEALRTRFEIEDGHFVQIIESDVAPDIEYLSMTGDALAQFADRWKQPHDIMRAPLCRARLVRLTDLSAEYVLLIDLHHAIVDGVSIGILVRDFIALYSGADLPSVGVTYGDYALWQEKLLHSATARAHREFWLRTFSDHIPVLNLPTDFERTPVRRSAGAHHKFALSAEHTRRLDARCAESGATRFMFLLAVFKVVLAKMSGGDDIVVGTVTAGRDHADVEQVVGMFANTLPIRVRLTSERGFNTVLADVRVACLDAFAHQHYPFEELVRELPVKRDFRRSPLFDVMFVYQGGVNDAPAASLALAVEPYPLTRVVTKFDLTLMMWENEGVLKGDMEYSTALFREESMDAFSARFRRVFEQVATNPNIPVCDIDIFLERERPLLVTNDSQSYGTAGPEDTVVSRFERAVAAESAPTAPFVAPATPLEEQICAVWREALHLERVGVQDDFFDIGGNSFSLIAVQAKLQSILKREIALITLVECPTIRQWIDAHLANQDSLR